MNRGIQAECEMGGTVLVLLYFEAGDGEAHTDGGRKSRVPSKESCRRVSQS